MRLTGAGVTGDNTLEGNEEKLQTYNHDVVLEQYRHAVRDAGGMTRQRAMFSIDEQSKLAIMDWGSEKLDALLFSAIDGSPTKQLWGGSATSKATLTTSDTLTEWLISKAKAWAITGGNRGQTPLRPVKVGGKNYFVLVVHPDVMYDLKQSTAFLNARREAEKRGSENPLFTGSSAIWDGVVIHEHENCTIGTDAGSGGNVPYANCYLMGAQSLCLAWGKRGSVVQETFDYGNQHGYAYGMICKASKPSFNSKDYGSLHIQIARTQIADA